MIISFSVKQSVFTELTRFMYSDNYKDFSIRTDETRMMSQCNQQDRLNSSLELFLFTGRSDFFECLSVLRNFTECVTVLCVGSYVMVLPKRRYTYAGLSRVRYQ
jgi:hypothetical protein